MPKPANREDEDLSDAHTKMPSLSGRKAIVTGGTTGIGRAIAVLLASEGVDVFVCGRNEQHLADGLQRIREVGKGDGISVDLADDDGVEHFVDAAKAYFGGGFDVAIVNAAIPAKGVTKMTASELRYAVAVDFTAYLATANAAVEVMEDFGDIVFIGSMSAHVLGPGSSVYAGMKAGIAGFSEALRKELGKQGIKVSNVEPGKTGADFQYSKFSAEEQAEQINKEWMLRAEDIAVAVHFVLTQPRRSVVQQVTVAPRTQEDE
ncbi:SDR family oxidoreductase [Pacificimonas flava]|uniref:3-oxoacyl-[acyl-carrier protein] reductase n=1 Tax=Pacificimonas flava TaxID=1234595 RepID=M2TQY6_9SPHN|nr:SDR family oxidoreductase [Pacificimonas flava]EMD84211.1 3-oxoacyl-[acyl-carrier protein] reductase [Pacificimonas flava]MBB5279912.1 NADP-dependent 3-hydroxy acid dehydrogenase YdfG [Pacificimonas flava]